MQRTSTHIPYLVLMQWLLLIGLIFFGIFMAWAANLLPTMLVSDNTRLSVIILIVFFLGCLHCFDRSLFLSRQFNVLKTYGNTALSSHMLGNSPINDYLQRPLLASSSLSSCNDEQDISMLTEVLAEKIRGQHQIGSFITSGLIKLGLLGTVIGFMLMLGSLDDIKSMDLEQVQTLMQTMTQGMKIALNTTLLGLGSSLLLGLQYLYLDRRADQLIAETIERGQENTGLENKADYLNDKVKK